MVGRLQETVLLHRVREGRPLPVVLLQPAARPELVAAGSLLLLCGEAVLCWVVLLQPPACPELVEAGSLLLLCGEAVLCWAEPGLACVTAAERERDHNIPASRLTVVQPHTFTWRPGKPRESQKRRAQACKARRLHLSTNTGEAVLCWAVPGVACGSAAACQSNSLLLLCGEALLCWAEPGLACGVAAACQSDGVLVDSKMAIQQAQDLLWKFQQAQARRPCGTLAVRTNAMVARVAKLVSPPA